MTIVNFRQQLPRVVVLALVLVLIACTDAFTLPARLQTATSKKYTKLHQSSRAVDGPFITDNNKQKEDSEEELMASFSMDRVGLNPNMSYG